MDYYDLLRKTEVATAFANEHMFKKKVAEKNQSEPQLCERCKQIICEKNDKKTSVHSAT